MARRLVHPLQVCLRDFEKTGQTMHGMTPNMLAIERAGERLGEKTVITFLDLDEFVRDAEDHWWFRSFWHLPKKEGQVRLSHRFCDLDDENEGEFIEELLKEIKQIELVTILLRFVRPDRYGILSPPVERVLNVMWGSDAVTTYMHYLQNLREISAEVPFEMVAHADMALWVLHAKYFCDVHGSQEMRNYFETDDFLLKLRAKNAMKPFHSIPLSKLARAMEDVRDDLAGVVACYWVEVAIRLKAKSAGAKWQGNIPLEEVIKDLAPRVEDEFRRRLDRCRGIRNNLFHYDNRPGSVGRQELFGVIEEIEKSIPEGWRSAGFICNSEERPTKSTIKVPEAGSEVERANKGKR